MDIGGTHHGAKGPVRLFTQLGTKTCKKCGQRKPTKGVPQGNIYGFVCAECRKR